MPLLEMKHITKSFAGVYANEDVDLSVEQGEIHALLGENGAGKTTLMNILFGIYQADKGEICFKGEHVEFKSPGEDVYKRQHHCGQQEFWLRFFQGTCASGHQVRGSELRYRGDICPYLLPEFHQHRPSHH